MTELSSTPRGGWGSDGVILLATAGSPIWRVSADGGSLTAVSKPDAKNLATNGHRSCLTAGIFSTTVPAPRGVPRIARGRINQGTLPERFERDLCAAWRHPVHPEGALFAQPFDVERHELAGEARRRW